MTGDITVTATFAADAPLPDTTPDVFSFTDDLQGQVLALMQQLLVSLKAQLDPRQ